VFDHSIRLFVVRAGCGVRVRRLKAWAAGEAVRGEYKVRRKTTAGFDKRASACCPEPVLANTRPSSPSDVS
jgi:hypothetical protein